MQLPNNSILSTPASYVKATPNVRSSRWGYALAAILIIAAVLRLSAFSLIEFRHDSAYWALDGLAIMGGGYFPLVGQQVGSVNATLYNGPFLSYIVALIFTIFGPQPAYVAFFIASLNIVGLAITFLLCRQLYSIRVGLIAVALGAVAPWFVLYGRMLWPQSLFPFLIPLALLILAKAIKTNRSLLYLLVGILFGIGVQLHLSAMALVGTGILVILIYARSKWQIFPYFVGTALGYVPLLIDDLQHNFRTVKTLMALPTLHAVHDPRPLRMIKTIWNLSNVFSGQGLWVSKIGDVPFLPAAIDWGQGLVATATLTAATALLLLSYFDKAKLRFRMPSYADGMMLLFFLLPFAYLLLSKSLIQRHYFLFIFPIPFVLIGRGLDLAEQLLTRLPSARRRFRSNWVAIRYGAYALLILLCTLNLVTVFYAYRFLSTTGGTAQFGTVLEDKQRAVELIIQDAGAASYQVHLDYVQERLPYLFEFSAQRGEAPLPLLATEESVQLLLHSRGSNAVHDYWLVETSYHTVPAPVASHLTLVAKLRGVSVYKHEP